jgi:O-antigen/teichoic acid export membrane protein
MTEAGADLKKLNRSLTGQMVHLMLGRGAALLFTFLIPILLARSLSIEEFGAYKQIFLLFGTYTVLLRFGLESSLYYFLPREPTRVHVYISQTIIFYIVIGVLFIGISIYLKEPIAGLMGNPSLSPHIPLVTFFTVMMLIAAPTEAIMIALKDARKASTVIFSFEALKAFLFTVPALLFSSVRAILCGAVLLAAGRMAFLGFYLYKGLGMTLSRITRADFTPQLRYALPFWVASILVTLADTSHLYIVSYLFGVTPFAIYSVGFFQLPVLVIVIESVVVTSMVSVTEYVNKGDYKTAAFIISNVTKKLFIVFFPLFCYLFLCAGDFIVLIYTSKFEASVPVFLVSLFLMPIYSFDLSYVLRSVGNTTYILGACVFRLVLTILLIVVFSRYFLLVGVVAGVVTAHFAVNCLFTSKVLRMMNLKLRSIFPPGPLAKIFGFAMVASLFTFLLKSYLTEGPALNLIFSFVVFFSIYLALIFYSGLVEEEIGIFRSFLRKLLPGHRS